MSVGLVIHALVFALTFIAIAYLVFAAAQKSEGLLKSGGVILAAVMAAIGVLALVGHLSAPMTGGRPFGIDMAPSAVSTNTATSTASTSGEPSGGASSEAKPGGDANAGDDGAAGGKP